jgi:asparagine synthase (glutamine-hydrolysing)
MCGIVGFLSLDGAPCVVDAARLTLVRDSLRHRGPDDAGLYVSPGQDCALAHRRLSIIDLSADARNPFAAEGGRLQLVFNGEIYNYVELREDLKVLGHRFRTSSDTEVLLAAYIEWREACLERLNGMFAFAVYDADARELFVARDRLGIKPLYTVTTGSTFGFASEIRALLASGLVEPLPDLAAIARFLATGALDGERRTVFSGIERLPAGHWLRVSRHGIEDKQYWSLGPGAEPAPPVEAPGRFRALFEDAVRLQMRSDVPIGVCLSGGLDSSSIFAVLARTVPQPVHAFSSVFPGLPEDESRFVRLMVARFGGQGHEVVPSGEHFLERVGAIVDILEEPCTHIGVYAQWHVMRLAHGHVKVLLDGQGGDELLAGYHAFFDDHLRDLRARLRARPGPGAAWRLLTEYAAIALQTRSLRLASLLGPSLAGRLAARPASPRAVDALTEEARGLVAAPGRHDDIFAGELANALARSLTGSTLLALLREEDKIAMAFSIETRVPFLDHRLVELAMALPGESKIRHGWTKLVLRQAMADVLPAEIAWRRDKKGFPAPIATWLRQHRDGVRDILLGPAARDRGLLRPDVVGRVLDAHLDGAADHTPLLWRWLMVELWFRSWSQRRPVMAPRG